MAGGELSLAVKSFAQSLVLSIASPNRHFAMVVELVGGVAATAALYYLSTQPRPEEPAGGSGGSDTTSDPLILLPGRRGIHAKF